MNKHRLLVQVTMDQTQGFEATKSDAHRALALKFQGLVFDDDRGHTWKVGPIMNLPSNEAEGRRAVCAEEGHVIPEKPTQDTFGCRRCDVIFGSVK